jgi:hypothetical protein
VQASGISFLSSFSLGVCPSNTILLRKTICSTCVVLGPKKSSTYSSEYASGFFAPAASHLPAAPFPRNEGLLGQTPDRRPSGGGWSCPHRAHRASTFLSCAPCEHRARHPSPASSSSPAFTNPGVRRKVLPVLRAWSEHILIVRALRAHRADLPPHPIFILLSAVPLSSALPLLP